MHFEFRFRKFCTQAKEAIIVPGTSWFLPTQVDAAGKRPPRPRLRPPMTFVFLILALR